MYRGFTIFYTPPPERVWSFRPRPDAPLESHRSAFQARRAIDILVDGFATSSTPRRDSSASSLPREAPPTAKPPASSRSVVSAPPIAKAASSSGSTLQGPPNGEIAGDIVGADDLIALLTDQTRRVQASSWPGGLSIDGAGLYTWWTDAAGAADLTAGLGQRISAGLIYAGQTGGTTVGGVVRMATLRSRIGGNHLRGRIRGSTFRFTLGAALMAPLGLAADAPKRLAAASEAMLSAWMRAHLSVCTVMVEDRASVMAIENTVLARLDPPLNLEGMQATSLRGQITRLRRELGSA